MIALELIITIYEYDHVGHQINGADVCFLKQKERRDQKLQLETHDLLDANCTST